MQKKISIEDNCKVWAYAAKAKRLVTQDGTYLEICLYEATIVEVFQDTSDWDD